MTVDMNKISPMMRHYLETKSKHKDAILMYRLGDFYEMFFEDAEVVSRELELALTGRDCGLEKRAPMCGVPYHAVDNYISRLIAKGYKVAICEQLSAPGDQKGIVDRDVIRVITAGTVMEDSMLDDKKDNYIASVFYCEGGIGVAWADISTGEFNLVQFEDELAARHAECMLNAVSPNELIVNAPTLEAVKTGKLSKDALNNLPLMQPYYDWAFQYINAQATLKKQLKTASLEAFECADKRHAVSAAGALLEYLLETQKRSLSHFNKLTYYKSNRHMYLDANTRRNLELTETIRERRKKGTLLWLLDKTLTNMGARNLRRYIDSPLIDETEIGARLDAVENLVKNSKLRKDIERLFVNIRDIERLAGKVAYGSINPREMYAIASSLLLLPAVKKLLENSKASYLLQLKDEIILFDELATVLNKAIAENAPMILREGGFIRDGYNAELDSYRSASRDGKEWLAALEAAEKEETGIKTLKIGYNKVFGYYIEVSKSYIGEVPYRYIRKQTLTNGERYITEELKQIEDKLLGASEKAIELEQKLFLELREALLMAVPQLKITGRAIAVIDTLYSLAVAAVENGYNKPIINEKINKINIVNGRHPVVEKLLSKNEFVSNDTYLDNGDNRTMIITGPNMAGKSTYMRQVALITFLAHIGSFVPADKAEISITDRIFTRVGASDDLSLAQSTFMVEMIEVASIVHNATDKSLLILDEIGRGTSTYDGLSIAWAVMEYVSEVIRAKTLFATHYHELTELEGKLQGVKNYRVLVNEHGETVIFLHRIARGGANKSFGIEVAALAGVPAKITIRAKEIAKLLELKDDKDVNAVLVNAMGAKKHEQISIFSDVSDGVKQIIKVLKDTNVDRLTPVQAILILSDLIERAKNVKN